MITIKNQTIYQCEYCNRRMLSRNGAKLHEDKYCWHEDSPHQKGIIETQANCDHPQTERVYRTMPGESHLLEPDYQVCTSCQKKM